MSKERSFKITPSSKKLFKAALKKCGDKVDLNGWRYSKSLGDSEYEKIEIDKENIYQFVVCWKFLKHFFNRAHPTETVFSEDLRRASEVWMEEDEDEPISISDGIMILAIVSRGLCPENMWYSMDTNQQARISPPKWKKFCKRYNYDEKVDWKSVNQQAEDDVIKIN